MTEIFKTGDKIIMCNEVLHIAKINSKEKSEMLKRSIRTVASYDNDYFSTATVHRVEDYRMEAMGYNHGKNIFYQTSKTGVKERDVKAACESGRIMIRFNDNFDVLLEAAKDELSRVNESELFLRILKDNHLTTKQILERNAMKARGKVEKFKAKLAKAKQRLAEIEDAINCIP